MADQRIQGVDLSDLIWQENWVMSFSLSFPCSSVPSGPCKEGVACHINHNLFLMTIELSVHYRILLYPSFCHLFMNKTCFFIVDVEHLQSLSCYSENGTNKVLYKQVLIKINPMMVLMFINSNPV